MNLRQWCEDNGYQPTDDSNELVRQMKEMKERIFQLELDMIEARQNISGKWKRDKMDMAKAHLELAGRACMHILYPETEPGYVGGGEE